jgi:hypothetical protein
MSLDGVAEEDKHLLEPFINTLDEYGLGYVIGRDTSTAQRSFYLVEVISVDEAKAMKSPAFWNSIVKQRRGSVHSSDNPAGGLATTELKESLCRLFDQLAFGFAYGEIKMQDKLNAPLYEGKEIHRAYDFNIDKENIRVRLINSI